MATSKHTHPDPFVLARDGDDASVEELAAIEFEPLPEDDRLAMYESLGNPRWNESAFNLGVALRLALAVMEKSKPDDCPSRWCGSAPIARYCVSPLFSSDRAYRANPESGAALKRARAQGRGRQAPSPIGGLVAKKPRKPSPPPLARPGADYRKPTQLELPITSIEFAQTRISRGAAPTPARFAIVIPNFYRYAGDVAGASIGPRKGAIR